MERGVAFSELIIALSKILDLTLPYITHHHMQVSYIAFNIAKKMNFKKDEIYNILIAGLLHDIGSLIYKKKEKLFLIEFHFQQEPEILYLHSYAGYLLLKEFKPFKEVANIIRFHHIYYKDFQKFKTKKVPIESHIIHLADRVSVLIDKNKEILSQRKKILQIIKENSGTMFLPELVNTFEDISQTEQFWLDLVNPYIEDILLRWINTTNVVLNLEEMYKFSEFLCKIIDFRSYFTSSHSRGVAICSEILARLLNFSKYECKLIKSAGLIHDLGKLFIPVEILEKPSQLTPEEENIIKSHPFYAYRVMENISEFKTINEWAFFHHERLDGTGYPFHLKGDFLPLGSRIMAIADIFTALSEDRPYRKGMGIYEVIKILKDLSEKSAIDGKIVSILEANIKEIALARKFTSKKSIQEYEKFIADIKNFISNPELI